MVTALPEYTMLQQVVLGVVLYASFIVHELGHVAAFRLFGIKTWFKLTWYGAVAGDRYHVLSLSPWQLLIVTVAGPIAGILFVLPFTTWIPLWYALVFNLFISSIDFLMILGQIYMGFARSWTKPAVYILGEEAWNESLKKANKRNI